MERWDWDAVLRREGGMVVEWDGDWVGSGQSQVSSLKSQVSSFQDEAGRNVKQWDWDWDAVLRQERGLAVEWDADWDWRGAPPLSPS